MDEDVGTTFEGVLPAGAPGRGELHNNSYCFSLTRLYRGTFRSALLCEGHAQEAPMGSAADSPRTAWRLQDPLLVDPSE